MSKRKRKKRLFFKSLLYIFLYSSLFLLVLTIIAYPWLSRKKTIIAPVVKEIKTEELNLSKILKDKDIEFVTIDLVSGYFDVKLKSGGAVYISSKKDIQAQVSSLQTVLKQLTINGKRFNVIDFRFEKPIIKYAL